MITGNLENLDPLLSGVLLAYPTTAYFQWNDPYSYTVNE